MQQGSEFFVQNFNYDKKDQSKQPVSNQNQINGSKYVAHHEKFEKLTKQKKFAEDKTPLRMNEINSENNIPYYYTYETSTPKMHLKNPHMYENIMFQLIFLDQLI